MKKIFSKEVLIGFLAVLSIAVLVIGIDFLKGVNVFQASNTYRISYENVQGLAVSAPVNVNGYKVGQVREISYEYDNPGHVLVQIDIDDELKLPEGTQAVLETDLLGTATISLKLGTSPSFITPGSKLPGVVPSGMMDKISTDVLPSAAAIFPKVDTLLTTLNRVVADPAITASVKRLDVITTNLEQTTRSLNALLATLPPITRDIKTVTGNFVQTSERLDTLMQNLGAIPVDSLVATLQTTLDNLEELSRQLKSPDSTLGQLMNNPALYNNLNHSIQSLDSLFIDIKKNPKRYISIKLL